ncbi:MAG TPA: plastocyanin/azurin family copper-binding protein [Nitrososphaera sp.]|nr:plastocyanin/azurin family copper-binding protein [Nitrososphaera sp.]
MASFVFMPIAAIETLGTSEAKIGRTDSVDIVANDEGDSLSAGLFVPDEIEVKKKTTITWTNTDPLLRHTVTEGSELLTSEGHIPLFDSGPIAADGGTYSHTFSKKGEFYYYCNIHPFITGEIVVK